MFIDQIKIYARAGHGGRGCVAFLREAFRPKGGPSGGNGGRGGSVILQADHDINNLIAQYYKPRLIAEDGEHGQGKGMEGKSGKDLLVKVPCGTMVWRLPSPKVEPDEASEEREDEDEKPILSAATSDRPVIRMAGSASAVEVDVASEENHEPDSPEPQDKELVADLTQHGERFVLCQGGRGGLGNKNFATARRQAPRFAQPGEPGGEGDFLFELRLMADIGLVGFPNAGKSTLLTAISAARPKIAPYPFTTLHPQIGIVEYEDYHRVTVCDVPGLIEGAHRNVGLGHAFLRHIQRCTALVFLLDMAGTDGRKPWDDYQQLLGELDCYDRALTQRPRLVVANKMDEAVAEENLKEFKRHLKKTPVIPISAAFDEGLDQLKQAMREAANDTSP